MASWQTAERTGAFSHMDYSEVQKYAHAYSVQELLSQQHVRALDALAGALGILSSSAGGDPTKAPPVELERFRQQVIVLRSILAHRNRQHRVAVANLTAFRHVRLW